MLCFQHQECNADCTAHRDLYFIFSLRVAWSSIVPSNVHPRKDTGNSLPGIAGRLLMIWSIGKRRPVVHLSAFTETGRAELSIEVPKQRFYTGRSRVIPCSLADTHCAILGAQGVLDRLNTILQTSYTLPADPSSLTSTASPAPSSATSIQDQLSLLSILEDYIQKNYDFGTAYALLRPVWNTVNPSEIQDELHRRERRDRELRQCALVGNRIIKPNLRPRRVWDLCSNRVVPLWITGDSIFKFYTVPTPTPISHAWVDEKDRVDVWTPINGKEWPVPIPKNADLNLIRIEMLNLAAEDVEGDETQYDFTQYAAEYAWLDVLCLRQKGGPREDLRVEEWRLDVPTIGAVYRNAKVLIYLNGLGRPLRLRDGDLDSDRSWFRRAWTLQEIGSLHIIAGDTPDGPMHTQWIDGRDCEAVLLTRFHRQLNSLKSIVYDPFAMMAHMQKRVSTNPVDRVVGLAFPLLTHTIPAYHESETLEDAWTALVNVMTSRTRAKFLFMYPRAGLGSKKWRPTWEHVMKEPLPQSGSLTIAQMDVVRNDGMDEDSYTGLCIQKGYVRGFDTGSAENHVRCGELVIEAADGIAHTFKIHVTHGLPIPEDTYTLLGGNRRSIKYWVVGRQLPDQRFEKVSVVATDYDDLFSCGLEEFTEYRRFVLL
ncbi:hypothetical protein EDD18DRAFT_1466534 [Armillaria luteobubalina]|uniref:Heterokaryon incompatibility domain-containing protein n=1 Tax=Armillaria luteobubalina TaxID=153913 RepID=A0AA39ULN0_9AGAR|nr:hypothetical protein EDD18DRAFT_1466534 [Armillaria luteobubalina]